MGGWLPTMLYEERNICVICFWKAQADIRFFCIYWTPLYPSANSPANHSTPALTVQVPPALHALSPPTPGLHSSDSVTPAPTVPTPPTSAPECNIRCYLWYPRTPRNSCPTPTLPIVSSFLSWKISVQEEFTLSRWRLPTLNLTYLLITSDTETSVRKLWWICQILKLENWHF